MRGEQQQWMVADERCQILRNGGTEFEDAVQRVDDCVARDHDVRYRHLFVQQRLCRPSCWRQVERRDLGGEFPVEFLGIRRPAIAAAQSGFDVNHRDALVERGEAGRECGGGVALHEHGVRLFLFEHRLEPLQHTRGDVREGLPGPDDVEIVVGHDAEGLQHFVEDCAMLTGDHHHRTDIRCCARRQHDRCHLDGLGSGAEDEEQCAHRPSLACGRGNPWVPALRPVVASRSADHAAPASAACRRCVVQAR